MACAISLLCVCLWAALHFGFAARLARLARAVRDFGDGRANNLLPIPGADEVHELSTAFAVLGTRLAEREVERVRLERVILETADREQRRIGADLHDGPGQQLTAASLATNGLITALESAAPALVPQAESLSRQLREILAEVRALSHGLAPVALADEGLIYALHELAEATTCSTGVRCIFDCPLPVSVPDIALAGHLYRIAQEAVNNAVKHASPHEIRVGLRRREHTLVLEVDDDGDGLPETLAAGGGIGLRVMRHRAQLIGGTFEVGSAPAGGTRIACYIPSPS
jgi:signal transduction histidine kinase